MFPMKLDALVEFLDSKIKSQSPFNGVNVSNNITFQNRTRCHSESQSPFIGRNEIGIETGDRDRHQIHPKNSLSLSLSHSLSPSRNPLSVGSVLPRSKKKRPAKSRKYHSRNPLSTGSMLPIKPKTALEHIQQIKSQSPLSGAISLIVARYSCSILPSRSTNYEHELRPFLPIPFEWGQSFQFHSVPLPEYCPVTGEKSQSPLSGADQIEIETIDRDRHQSPLKILYPYLNSLSLPRNPLSTGSTLPIF